MTSNDLPITALCVVADKSQCPSNYTPVWKSFDTNVETDLWKDSLFGKKINRFICYTKDYPINDTYNVIEDIKLLNERENMIGGFIPIEKCLDNSDKSFQKKILCIKVQTRFYTPTAVSDIIILARSKRPPVGYSLIGEINNHTICVKFSPVNPARPPAPLPPTNQSITSSMSHNIFPNVFSSIPPPIPPRPASVNAALNERLSNATIEQSYVHIDSNAANRQIDGTSGSNQNEFMSTLNRHISQTGNYNPLQGVPFEINPIYDNSSTKDNLDLNRLKQTLNKPNDLINQLWYDFNLENSYLQQNEA